MPEYTPETYTQVESVMQYRNFTSNAFQNIVYGELNVLYNAFEQRILVLLYPKIASYAQCKGLVLCYRKIKITCKRVDHAHPSLLIYFKCIITGTKHTILTASIYVMNKRK